MPPEPQPKDTSTTGPPSWMAPVKPVVPDHELIRRIGGGSYGDVWLARTTVGTWRAVKVVFRDRFTDARPYEREFNGIQKFEPLSRGNEAFIDILQIGRNDAEGYFYYVMELADDANAEAGTRNAESPLTRPADTLSPSGGEGRDEEAARVQNPVPHSALRDSHSYIPKTLSKVLLQRGRLPVSECLELGLSLNLGLAHLHHAGLIHRDIKPSNIIFVGGVPKLADIGLVIEVAEARSFVGTEGFIPPEGPNSPQADLYSLGKVLYEAGMGKDRKDFPEPFTQIAEAPDATELLEFNAILLKACAANVQERYQSAEEMNADLALLQSGGSVRRQRKLAGQLRFVQRAGATVTALAAVIALGWWWQAKQTRAIRELADQKSQLAEEKTKLAEENRNRIVRLDIANGVRLLDEGNTPGALLWFADALPLLTNTPAAETIHRIRIQQTLDQIPRLLQVMAHESAVMTGDFSPDGRQVATGTMEGKLRIWEVSSGVLVRPPLDMGNLISQVLFSADGRRLLVCSAPPLDNSSHGNPKRGFATVLDVASGQEIFPRLASNLVAVSFSPDGRWLAAATTNHVIRLFDAQDGRLAAELKGHTDEIMRLSFGADGKLLASAGRDRTARLWRLPSGEPLGPPLQHEAAVHRVLLSDDSRRLLTSTDAEAFEYDCVIQTWDVHSGQKVGPPLKERTRVNGLFFDRPDAKRFFTAGMNPKVRVWDTEQHNEALPALDLQGEIGCWALRADGSLLAVGSSDSNDPQARIWDLRTGEHFSRPLRHTAWVVSTRFAPDGKLCLTTSSDSTAKLWALGLPIRSATAHCDVPLLAEFAHRLDRDLGRQPGPIPIFTRNGSVRLFDVDRWMEVNQLVPSNPEWPPNRCAVAPSGRSWATFHWKDRTNASSETIGLWRERNNTLEHLILNHPQGVSAVAFQPDEARLLTAGRNGQIRVWKTADGALECRIPLLQTDAQVWAFSPDAARALLVLERCGPGRVNDVLQVFDLELGKPVGPSFQCPAGEDFGFDPPGNRVAAASQDGYVRIFDARSGQLTSPPLKHPDQLLSLDWSADGRRVLAAGFGGYAVISDAATGEQILSPMRTGTRNTLTARWSPDGRFIVTRNNDGSVRLWDAATAEAITPLLPHKGSIRLATVTRSGRLFTLSDPDEVRAWDLAETRLPADVIGDYAKLASGRRLSANGVPLPLKAEELATLATSLRVRAPELFATP